MPCWSVITNSVDMPAMQGGLVDRALSAIGATNVQRIGNTVYFTVPGEGAFMLANGKLTGRSQQSEEAVAKMAGRLKRGYSHQVVQATAKKRGWSLRKTGPNQYVATKR